MNERIMIMNILTENVPNYSGKKIVLQIFFSFFLSKFDLDMFYIMYILYVFCFYILSFFIIIISPSSLKDFNGNYSS